MTSNLCLEPWKKINSLGDVCVFDIETNGLMPHLSRFHCAVIIDLATLREYRYGPEDWKAFVYKLTTYPVAVGHNICAFDFKALLKLFNVCYFGWKFDTMILSRLINPERPQGHSLSSWGYSLKFHKGVFGETTNWEEFSDEMLEYCAQDGRLNSVLFLYMIRNLGWCELFKTSLEEIKIIESAIRSHKLEVIYGQSKEEKERL